MRYATRTHEEGIIVRLPDATDQVRLAPVRALRAVFSGVGQLLLAADRLREEDASAELESGDDQRDALRSWDGRLSSSVRLLTPAGAGAPGSAGAGAAPGGKSEPRGRKAGPRGRKSESAGKARPADSARAERPSKAARQQTRGGKKAAHAKRATGTKASGAGSRKAGRSKDIAEAPRFRSLDLTGNVRMLTDDDVADLTADQFGRGMTVAQPGLTQPGPTLPGPIQPGPARESATAAPVWSDAAPAWSSWSASAAETPQAAPAAAALPISGYDELSLPSLRARLRSLDAAELADLLAHERSHANREDVVTMFERRIAKLEESAG